MYDETLVTTLADDVLHAIFEDAAIGIALLDAEGRVLESNPALQTMLARDAATLAGTPLRAHMHPEASETDRARFCDLIEGKRKDYQLQARFTPATGPVIWANLTVSRIRRQHPETRYAIAMVEDVTEQQQAQAALIQAEKLAVTGRLAASLAHEINNPLQIVIGCLGLADETLAEGGDVTVYLQMASEELRRAARIVAQLRDLNRRSQPEEKAPTALDALLEQVLLLARSKCQERGIAVAWERGAQPVTISVVPDRIQQVFLNLVLNAIEAMSASGRLTLRVTATKHPAGACVTIADSGPGMASEVISQLFAPFFTTKPEGMGLGLFISQNIVADHGGRITVESQPGQGTTFKVWLPA